MGRSKKNWDHLVDFYGNYGIDIANGLFPGSGNAPGIKGNKGEVGFDGPKGEKGFKGSKGDRGYGQKGNTGDPGSEGIKGDKGGPGGLFTFKGTITDESELPSVAEPGDVYYNTTTGDLFAYDSNEWVNVGGISDPVKGDKGEYGDIGQKGEPGLDGAEGAGGVTGDKGEKGENFDPLILDDYYPINIIDQLIEHHHEPEKAFDVSYYKDLTSIVQNETVDFGSSDQQDELYNPGIVVIESSCTINNSPVSSARQIVVNYVVDNAGRLRGQGYQMIQHVYAAELDKTDDSTYWRLVRPNRNEFGEWHNSHFPDEDYYDKAEIDSRISSQGLVFLSTAADNTEQLVLQDKNGNVDPTFVRFHSTGGITLTRNGNRLTFDGSPLAGQLLFLGLLGINEDVTASVPTPAPGNYFIFKENGTDINTGETVAVGDWLIYGEDPQEWRHLPMGVSYGVAQVNIKGEKPYLTETGSIQFPELGFDTPEFERDFPAREGTIDVMNGSIWNLNDVKTDYIRNEMHGFDTKVDWNDTLAQGQWAVNVAAGKVRISDKNSFGANTEDLLEGAMVNAGNFLEAQFANRTETVADKLISYEAALDGWIINFDNRSMPVFLSSESSGALTLILCFSRTDVKNGDALVWNHAEQKFIPATPGEGVYVEIEGDTMKGDLNMDGNDLNGLQNPPPTDTSAASKEWVLELLDEIRAVPVGVIMYWPSSKPIPTGWFKMDGASFNTSQYPQLHEVLQGITGYTSGKIPDYKGYFLHHTAGMDEYYDNGGLPGKKLEMRTALPRIDFKTDEIEHDHKTIGMNKRGMSAAPNTGRNCIRPYGTGDDPAPEYPVNKHKHKHVITGGDPVTRPKTVNGYWIIRGD